MCSDQCESPKPELPKPEAYELPDIPARELGPPPPGYGRYADASMDRSAAAQGGYSGGAAGGFIRRNLDEVTCFKASVSCIVIDHMLMYDVLSAAREAITLTNVRTVMFRATEVDLIVDPTKILVKSDGCLETARNYIIYLDYDLSLILLINLVAGRSHVNDVTRLDGFHEFFASLSEILLQDLHSIHSTLSAQLNLYSRHVAGYGLAKDDHSKPESERLSSDHRREPTAAAVDLTSPRCRARCRRSLASSSLSSATRR
jgi:hypothetical protein